MEVGRLLIGRASDVALEDPILASFFAVSGSALIVRTEAHLYRIEQREQR